MYRTIVIFMAGYYAHKHVSPVVGEVARKTAIKMQEQKDAPIQDVDAYLSLKEAAEKTFARALKNVCPECEAPIGELCDTTAVWVHLDRLKLIQT